MTAKVKLRAAGGIAAGTVEQILTTKFTGGSADRCPLLVPRKMGGCSSLLYFASAFSSVIQQNPVELGAFDLISSWIFAAEDIAEQKLIRSSAAGRYDLAAILYDHVGAVDFFFHAHPFNGAQAAVQQRCTDFNTRKS